MPKFKFRPEDLRRCFVMAKLVKPKTNDICLRFVGNRLVLFCSDNRSYSRAETSAEVLDKLPDNYKSEDYYITLDRSALFDSDLESVTISVNEKSLSIQAVGEGQTRSAVLKKRSVTSRRPPVPEKPQSGKKFTLNTTNFDLLLKQVSCSAQIRETKTDEAMRVNQVHFYPESFCAVSNARYYGSVAFLPGFDMELSIVSSDIPTIKAFCARLPGKEVSLFQDNSRLYAEDPITGSILALSKVSCNKPPLVLLDRNEFKTLIIADQIKLSQSLQWALLALEGTQRVSLRTVDNQLEFFSGNQELSKIPVSCVHVQNDGLRADFPAKFLASIVRYIGEGRVALRFGHTKAPSVLELSQHCEETPPVEAFHYLQSMKEHK